MPSGTRNIQISIKDIIQRAEKSATKSFTVPFITPKDGSTKHYPCFNIDEEPLLVAFVNNLTSFDGGSKTLIEARQVATDVSKYLAFANHSSCKWECLTDTNKLKEFIELLR